MHVVADRRERDLVLDLLRVRCLLDHDGHQLGPDVVDPEAGRLTR